MDASALGWHGRRPARSPIRIGLALIAIGLLLSAASFASMPLLARLERHARNTAQLEAASSNAQARAAAAAAAVHRLDIVWSAYSPKIRAVLSGLDGTPDARVLLAFRVSIARQYNDTAPAHVLDRLPPVVAEQPDGVARRASFRSVFDETRRHIRTVFKRIMQALRPSRAVTRSGPAAANASVDAAAVDALFAAETQLQPHWAALREAAAQAASDAATDAEHADTAAAQAERENPWGVLIEP